MLTNAEIEAFASDFMQRRHKQSHPNDNVFQDVRRVGSHVVPFGIQGQGALGVFDAHRGDVDLVSYVRSPWALLQKPIRNIAQSALCARYTGATRQEVTATDVLGASATFVANANDATVRPFNDNLGTAGGQIVMRWGSVGTAATATDTFLLAQVDSFNASSFSIDQTLFTDTFSGSKVYAGANTTAREIGFSQAWRKQDNSASLAILFDRTIISDTTVNTGQTVAVSYTVQF